MAYRVVRVIDGDTIIVGRDRIEPFKVRLIGVDTPEVAQPTRQSLEYYGREASLFAADLLKGEHVYLACEGDPPTKDKYARILAYVYRAPDGLFVNAEIIRQGYGHAYVRYTFKYLEEFRRLDRSCQAGGKGPVGPTRQGVRPPQDA